jgi:putative membrane protein
MNRAQANCSITDYILITLKGFCMGAADVVPGVSGGTMAFILGIYEELITAIRSFDLDFFRLASALKIKEAVDHASIRFLVALGTGILIAIFSLARILSWLLLNQPVLIWSFFMGLILASVITISKKISKWSSATITWMILGAAGAYLLVGSVPVSTPNATWFIFLSGAIAICAMILPGISGSFILVLLGKYHYILEAVNNRDVLTIITVAAGAGVGILTFSHFLNWLLKNYHDMTIALLTGLMLGSLRKVWPWKETLQTILDSHGKAIPVLQANILPPQWSNEIIFAILLMAAGSIVVLLLSYCAERKDSLKV